MGTIAIGSGELSGERIYIAKKIPTREDIDLAERFLRDLWFISKGGQEAHESYPQYEDQFPRLYGIQYNEQGQPVNVVMEDYSQRNSLHLIPPEFRELAPSIPNLVQTEGFDIEEYKHVGVKIKETGQVRLIDFDSRATIDLAPYQEFLEKLRFEPKGK